MTSIFSNQQQKAINFIWVLGIIIAILQISNYFINNYGPETPFYNYLWETQNWFLESLVFAWYFYRNKLITKGIIIQVLFMPYYIFKSDWAGFLDYHLEIENSEQIYTIVNFATFIIPLILFTIFYYRAEIKPAGTSKIKAIITQFVFTFIFSYILSSDPDSLYNFVGGIVGTSLYQKDIAVCAIFLLIAFKTVSVLIAFFYLSNRIYNLKELVNPIDVQPISAHFFKWGFLISYPILLLLIVEMGVSVFTMSFSSSGLKIPTVLNVVSGLIFLFITARFFANLIQFRNYTLKNYFGVINAFSVLPVLNLAPFFLLIFAKINTAPISNYIQSLKQKRNIHLAIYCALLVVYYVYQYFSKEKEIRDFSVFYKLIVFVISIILLARFKLSTKIVPFLAVAVLYFSEIKDLFDFTDGFLSFLKNKIISFVWLGTLATFILYYVTDYILHKCFYTEYFEQNDEDKFKAYIERFQ
ncbi:hypothetical protein [Pedobacter miscanthi]|uniref:Uncharacterized protein n=1 Tax=Pedobacter miscanthi TaxID=2259170 RepID=A0A366L8U1_9SPHI|nr:hypothetical protein [Pedobacter miscanthi]RBQ10301.1 hypothetical protein DRW42_04540 [Pedobacter miscanthi]